MKSLFTCYYHYPQTLFSVSERSCPVANCARLSQGAVETGTTLFAKAGRPWAVQMLPKQGRISGQGTIGQRRIVLSYVLDTKRR